MLIPDPPEGASSTEEKPRRVHYSPVKEKEFSRNTTATPAQQGMWKILQRQEKRRDAFKELLLHLVFTSVFLTVIMLQRDVNTSFWMNSAINAAFIGQPMPFSAQQFSKDFLGIQQWVCKS
jgi:hypothetical protein